MYGTQTLIYVIRLRCQFENDVKMYGTQTAQEASGLLDEFENDVKMYGTQTDISGLCDEISLRMM